MPRTPLTIFDLAKLAERRDGTSVGHTDRVRAYCRLLAVRMLKTGEWPAVDAAFVRRLGRVSVLHDIGKAAVPDTVLLKPGKLTRDEFAVMQTHTTRGADALAAAARDRPRAAYLRMAHEIALSHHEKWDGSGYPHGLAGEAIPLAARVVAVADVYDALTSERCYKPSFDHATAHGIVVDGAAAHFDPRIVDVFRATSWQFNAVRERLGDRSLRAA